MQNLKLPQILEKVESLPAPRLIAISGFGGSGKSTLAKKLGEAIGAPVVGVDSFQKDGVFDTDFSMWEIMDFARLEREVLAPFMRKEEVISYGHFDTNSKAISETIELKNNGTIIVEGVGLFRPELMKYFTYTMWVDCPLETAIARGKKRDREEYNNPVDELWDGIWKANDEQCFAAYKPKDSASLIVVNG